MTKTSIKKKPSKTILANTPDSSPEVKKGVSKSVSDRIPAEQTAEVKKELQELYPSLQLTDEKKAKKKVQEEDGESQKNPKKRKNIESQDGRKNNGANFKGNKPEGSGMKLGQKTRKTLDKEEAKKLYQERMLQRLDELIFSQMSLAVGTKQVFRKDGRRWSRVVDEDVILSVLNGEAEEGEYYTITTETPDGTAIANILDRIFGKPTQAVVTKDEDGKDQPINFTVTIED